ncbi:iron response transcriptional regulator IrrA (plasmid) [Mesorhizobium sp. ORM8.1]
MNEPLSILSRAGLRPTKQRIELCKLLFAHGNRHVSAETLFEEATNAGINVSLATVYNTLHQLSALKLIRELALDVSRTYFDTNPQSHHHFFFKEDNAVIDIEAGADVDGIPEPPDGYEIAHVDVVIRLRRKA